MIMDQTALTVIKEDAIRSVSDQANPVETAPIPHQAGSPMWAEYRVAIPEAWKAHCVVLYPISAAPDGSMRPDMPAALTSELQQFRAGVLLCHPETDGQEAVQEFQSGALLEAAFLSQDGQYLQASPLRPIYGLVPLAAPSPTAKGHPRSVECLVLLPCFDPLRGAQRAQLPPIMPIMMFAKGVCVYRSDAAGEAE